ncbi:MAG: c-di-GMP-binding flagellar brake protein YcgR, partial [Myxococcota bacterium]
FLRAEIPVALQCEVVGPDYVLPGEPKSIEQPGWNEQMVDLSGSGVRFLWDSLCASGDVALVSMQLPLPNKPTVHAIGEVVRAKRDPESGKLDVAIHFSSVDQTSRDRMINCVFRNYYEQLGVRGPIGGDDDN